MSPVGEKGAGFKARATLSFRGVRDGEVYPQTIPVGSILEGALALDAVKAGKAVPLEPQAAAAPKPAPGAANPTQAGPERQSSSAPRVPAKAAKTSPKPKAGRASS